MQPNAKDLLDNIMWRSLTGPHARFAAGEGDARRYAKGFSPIVGFKDAARPDLAALIPFCETGESFYCDIWSDPAPDGWRIDKEATMFKMVWEGVMPESDEAQDAIPLRAEHAAQAVELAALTNPGPFGLRTIELGEYFGYFDDSRLIAMTGERMAAGPLHEVSSVCTHPAFQGQGLARASASRAPSTRTVRRARSRTSTARSRGEVAELRTSESILRLLRDHKQFGRENERLPAAGRSDTRSR